jgi:hypothetical protein
MDASDAVFPVLSKAKPLRGSRRKVIGVKHYRFPIFEYNVSRIWNWIVWLLVASPDRSLLLGLVANVIVFIMMSSPYCSGTERRGGMMKSMQQQDSLFLSRNFDKSAPLHCTRPNLQSGLFHLQLKKSMQVRTRNHPSCGFC